MIYMVEHTFARPDMEADWNAWYGGNVKVLLGVPGFRTAQRFAVPGTTPPRYMAMYTVESAAVFESEAYRKAGGGGTNSQRFRPAYQAWHRNLLDFPDAPVVGDGDALLVLDRAAAGGQPFAWHAVVGLHCTTPVRGLAVMRRADAARVVAGTDITLYLPLGPQHTA